MSTAIAQPPLEGFGAGALCSCGIVGCRELGWPHDWNPAETGDSCALLCTDPFVFGEKPGVDYVRWGSGHAHVSCVEAVG